MIRQIRLGLKMLQYSHRVGVSVGIMAALLPLALAVEFIPIFERQRLLGDYLILMNGMWLVQQIFTVNVTSFAQTSRWKRRLQTSVPVIIGFCGFAVCYLIVILIKLLGLVGADAGQQGTASMLLLGDAVIGVWTMVYCGVAYKFYIPSTIIFFVFFYGGFWGLELFAPRIDLPFWAAAGIGYLILAAGALLQYGLTRLVYRFSLDKRGQMHELRKYM